MILRIWHGWTTRKDADTYQRLSDETIVPGILAQDISGLRGVEIFRRHTNEADREVEFITIMSFADWQGVEEFAGPEGTTSVVPARARALLSRYDQHSQHYELVGAHPTSG